MTKILDLYTGEFLRFVSSVTYDAYHKDDVSGYVIDIENSFRYVDQKTSHSDLSIIEYNHFIINTFISDSGSSNKRFEIIYD